MYADCEVARFLHTFRPAIVGHISRPAGVFNFDQTGILRLFRVLRHRRAQRPAAKKFQPTAIVASEHPEQRRQTLARKYPEEMRSPIEVF